MWAKPAYATCPVCIITVGGGLWIADKLGVDDLIASIWIGALVTALATTWADKGKLIKLPKAKISWTIIFYALTILTLEISGKLDSPYCKIWGVCKIWLGVTIGTIAFWLGIWLDRWLRTKNKDKVFFPFQKVVAPVLTTVMASLIFYLLIC